jgi:hypothetical protein
MKIYRGDADSNFQPQKHINSRYGIIALFFTTDIKVAKLYAKQRSDQERIYNDGAIYTTDLPNQVYSVDFNGEVSHSSKFRNLIYKLHQENHKVVCIKNVYDYPSKDYFELIKSDIIVYFNINNLNVDLKNI